VASSPVRYVNSIKNYTIILHIIIQIPEDLSDLIIVEKYIIRKTKKHLDIEANI
jgi:hypothetical protein